MINTFKRILVGVGLFVIPIVIFGYFLGGWRHDSAADLPVLPKTEATKLIEAVKANDISRLTPLLQNATRERSLWRGEMISTVRTSEGYTLLQLAILSSSDDIVHAVAMAGATTDDLSTTNQTALDLAIQHGRSDVADFLKQRSAKTGYEVVCESFGPNENTPFFSIYFPVAFVYIFALVHFCRRGTDRPLSRLTLACCVPTLLFSCYYIYEYLEFHKNCSRYMPSTQYIILAIGATAALALQAIAFIKRSQPIMRVAQGIAAIELIPLMLFVVLIRCSFFLGVPTS